MPRHLPWRDHVHPLGLTPVWVDTEGQLRPWPLSSFAIRVKQRQLPGAFVMPSHLPNPAGDVSRGPDVSWAEPFGKDLGGNEAETRLTGDEHLEILGPVDCQRRYERLVAPPCPPVLIQLPSPGGEARTEWFYADILDISLGGLCLLISGNHDLQVGQTLQVDFNVHRTTDLHRVAGFVRWFVRSGTFNTMGVGFSEPLPQLPQLLPERRNSPRDPKTVAD